MKKTLILGLLMTSTLLVAACGGSKDDTTTDVDTVAGSPDAVAVASCLSDNGRTMYGTETCPHCQDQKKAFGDAFAQVNYVDCQKEQQKCTVAGIQGVPTRVGPADERIPGAQTLAALAKQTGCEMPNG